MAAPAARPCEPWPAEPCCTGLPDDVEPEVMTQALAVATEILWVLSGRRFGTCTVAMRPCRRACVGGVSWSWSWWRGINGLSPATPWPAMWALDVACACPQPCGCDRLCELRLPLAPVIEVLEVRIDGQVLPAVGAYRVDDFRTLVRLDDPDACWPACQDMAADATQPDTFLVRWSYGRPVPSSGLLAVGVLACEIAKACLSLPCELPRRVTQVARQGVTMSLLDPQQYLDRGRTGIYLVDLFLATYNPSGLRRRPRVLRADDKRRRWRRTGT